MVTTAPPAPFIELGTTGLDRSYGVINNDPLRELQGERGRKVLEEMSLNDPVVGALLFSIDMLMRQAEWRVESESDSSTDSSAAEFVESCLHDLERPFKEVVSEILSMLVYGWSFHELVFKERRGINGVEPSSFTDGRIGWHKIAGRSQNTLARWNMNDAGDVLAMVQQAPPLYNEVAIPLNKALLFRTSSRFNNPEGRSILRTAYRAWYIKKNIENIQAIGIERDLAGLPVLYVPPEYLMEGASAEYQALLADFKKMLRNIRRDEQEGIIVPMMYDEDHGKELFKLELLSTGGRRQFNVKEIIEYYDARMAMTTMTDFILLGHEIHGSFALADSKTEMLTHALGAWMDVISDQFNRKAIPQLLMLNGMPFENPPRLTHSDVETVDLGQLGTYIQQLGGANVLTWDAEMENYLRRQAHMPERDPNSDDRPLASMTDAIQGETGDQGNDDDAGTSVGSQRGSNGRGR